MYVRGVVGYVPMRPTAPPYQFLELFSIFSINRIAHTFGAPVNISVIGGSLEGEV